MEPSSCLTSVPILDAIYSTTSFGISFSKLPEDIFFRMIWVLREKSGGKILTVNPQQNLVLSLSSNNFKSSGERSEEMIICLLSLYKVLKV